MAVVLRLSRQGSKKKPFYRVVATDKRSPRDGKFIELVGTYDPRTKVLKVNKDRYTHWVSKGAIPSGTLHTLVKKQDRAAAAPVKA
jgi:small subunit ribosomal protein S16